MTSTISTDVVKGKKIRADRTDVGNLVHAYQTAKNAEKVAKDAAESARAGLLALAGDAEWIIDPVTGLDLVGLPERSRPGFGPVKDVLAAFADRPDVLERLEALVKISTYRVVVAR